MFSWLNLTYNWHNLIEMGYILLEGGSEFGGQMAAPDLRAIELAGGSDARISIIPAAAAPDYNHLRAGENGVRWFQSLGAQNVSSLPLTDRNTADDPAVVAALRRSRLIYLLGGFPDHLGQSLAGSRSWQAMLDAWNKGAVLAGSSAGAMVLCSHYYDPEAGRVVDGLGLVPGSCVLPHYNTFGQKWATRLSSELPDTLLIGIDEETGMLGVGEDTTWRVYGKGLVTLYNDNEVRCFKPGNDFKLSDQK